ncbi:unnamed protein product, partial [Mesorhabditis spiculigera]
TPCCIYGGLVSGLNSASNIFIYGWKYEELRNGMIQVVTCRPATIQRENSSYNVLNKQARRDDVFL